MLLIRILGKDYTFSREAWAALTGATNSGRVYYYPARGQNLTVDNLAILLKYSKIARPIISPQEIDAISTNVAVIADVPASYVREQIETLINKLCITEP